MLFFSLSFSFNKVFNVSECIFIERFNRFIKTLASCSDFDSEIEVLKLIVKVCMKLFYILFLDSINIIFFFFRLFRIRFGAFAKNKNSQSSKYVNKIRIIRIIIRNLYFSDVMNEKMKLDPKKKLPTVGVSKKKFPCNYCPNLFTRKDNSGRHERVCFTKKLKKENNK